MGIVLRPAESRDAAAIAAVHLAARRVAMPYLPEVHSDAETYAWVAEHVLSRHEVWVAEVNGRVVGVASLEGDFLEQLYVLPGYQGMGIGSALFTKAQDYARTASASMSSSAMDGPGLFTSIAAAWRSHSATAPATKRVSRTCSIAGQFVES